jgi:PRTRC genetic system protein B
MSSRKEQVRPVITGPLGMQADAALYFVEDQLVFHGIGDDGAEQIKFISTASLREAALREPTDSGWLPPDINRCGTCSKGAWMVGWHSPAIYKMWLEEFAEPLRVPMPSLIWIGIRNSYFVFAAKQKLFTPNARLFHAPMANVDSHGLTCFGSNKRPDVADGGFDPAWDLFWSTPFNNHHDDHKSKQYPDGINEQLCALSKARAKTYPMRDLVAVRDYYLESVTLTDAVEKILGRGKK